MLRFSVLALLIGSAAARSALPRSAPLPSSSPVLNLRGGSTDMSISNAVVMLNAASGVFGFISPSKNLEAYGADGTPTPDKTAYMRYASALQIATAAILTVGDTKGAEGAVAASLSAAAVALLMSVPGFETLGGPKEPVAIWIVGLAILGKLAREGNIEAGMAMKIAVAINVLNGLQFYFAPDSAIDMYKVKVPVSDMAKSIFTIGGLNLISMGAYLYVASTKSHMEGLVAWLFINALGALKAAFVDADKVGFEKKGPLAWAAIQSVLGYMALKASE